MTAVAGVLTIFAVCGAVAVAATDRPPPAASAPAVTPTGAWWLYQVRRDDGVEVQQVRFAITRR